MKEVCAKRLGRHGEYDAVKLVLALADRYGYGNLIGHLRRAWAEKLMNDLPNMTWDKAIEGTSAAAYPREWTPEGLYKP